MSVFYTHSREEKIPKKIAHARSPEPSSDVNDHATGTTRDEPQGSMTVSGQRERGGAGAGMAWQG